MIYYFLVKGEAKSVTMSANIGLCLNDFKDILFPITMKTVDHNDEKTEKNHRRQFF